MPTEKGRAGSTGAAAKGTKGAFVSSDNSFARLVSLAAHDLRTPLATVHGFARTLTRTTELAPPADRYVEMIEAASEQLGELIDELGLAARIEGGRYDPVLREVDSLTLAREAAERLGEERVAVAGDGATVQIDADAVSRGFSALVQAALRHGGLERVDVTVKGAELEVAPATAASAPVLLGDDLRDLGAAVAIDGETLRVRLPQ
jgi:signal transduction histidine kinase